MIDNHQIEQYLLQSLNMALDNTANETSYTNSFDIRVTDKGFYWIPRLPSSLVINDELYERIYEIANVAVYPNYTLLKQNGIYIVKEDIPDIHIQRSLFFPWTKGIPTRLFFHDLEEKAINNHRNIIPIMQNLEINYDKVTSIMISGNSGSGKSYFLVYLLTVLHNFSTLVVCDPKIDIPARWCKYFKIKSILPVSNRSKSDFVSQINNELSYACKLISERQQKLFLNPELKFKHFTIVIDEIVTLTEGIPKPIKDAFNALISQIFLTGRAVNVHMLCLGQRFDYNSIPPSSRDQANVLIQLGNINSRTVQFLYPDLNPKGIVIPAEKGAGLIQVIDSEHPYQVQPLLTPTYTLKSKGIF